MIEEICKRNHHCLGQSPAETTSHGHSIALVKQLLAQLLSEKLTIAIHNLLKYCVSWLKFLPHLLQKMQIKKRFIQCHDLLIRPMHHSLCQYDAPQIWIKKRILPSHFVHDQEQCQNIEILIIIVFTVETWILW